MKLKDYEKIEKQMFSTIEKPETSLKGLNSHRKKDFEEDLYQNVLYQLEERKIYLMPDLSLIKFSQIVGTNTSYLSKVVNHRFGCNFRTLVNKYRVAYAIKLMQNIGEGCSIDEISRRSGFFSRSVFYDAFLKVMGKSPSRCLEEKNERVIT
jgi:AraC-like DNA-binding protein